MNNIQKAKLTNIINRMKRGNPPATEAEISKVIQAYTSQEESSPLKMSAYDAAVASISGVTDSIGDAVESGIKVGEDAIDSVQKGVGDAVDYVGKGIDDAVDYVGEGIDDAVDYVEEGIDDVKWGIEAWTHSPQNAYGDPLDMSNTETIIDKSEGVVVDAYLDSPDHPGLAVEKAGFMFGDAVNFVRPDG